MSQLIQVSKGPYKVILVLITFRPSPVFNLNISIKYTLFSTIVIYFVLGIRIHIHVTPYQIQDDRRPWIKKEEKTFSDILVKLRATVDRRVHFDNLPPSLLSHFDVLKEFSKK